jgi:hypothetical protein
MDAVRKHFEDQAREFDRIIVTMIPGYAQMVEAPLPFSNPEIHRCDIPRFVIHRKPMAAENSFAIVSNVDLPEVTNAIQQALKEIHPRYDLNASPSDIQFDGKEEILLTSAGMEKPILTMRSPLLGNAPKEAD